MRAFRGPDGTSWGVELRSPGASNAMIVFHHPGVANTRRTRYAWINWEGPEARNVTARLDADDVLTALSDDDVALLFRRSMPVAGFGVLDTTPPASAAGLGPVTGLGPRDLRRGARTANR